jgi:type III pantothenate kinase
MLVVDVGNTRFKWARVGDTVATLSSRSFATPTEPSSLASSLDCAWSGEFPPSRVVVGSVAGAALEQKLAEWVRTRWQVDTEFLRSRAIGWGVCNGYDRPDTLGVDRWAALVAARQLYPGALVIVDCGTAATVDALERNGQHAGGIIIPGVALMKRSLLDNTKEIHESEPSHRVGFASSTGDAVHSGAILALTGLVEKVVREFARRVDESVTTVLTGGEASTVRAALTLATELQEQLVLSGLAIMAEQKA